MDCLHQEAAGREVSGVEAGDRPAERRRPRQGVFRNADDIEGVSVGEVDHGDFSARRAWRRRSRASGECEKRGCDWLIAAEHYQNVYKGWRRADGDSLEHARPGLSDCPRGGADRPQCADARHVDDHGGGAWKDSRAGIANHSGAAAVHQQSQRGPIRFLSHNEGAPVMRGRSSVHCAALCIACSLAAGAAQAQGRGGPNWTTYNSDAQRTSWMRTDPRISRESVQKPGAFQLIWKAKLDNQARQLTSLT